MKTDLKINEITAEKIESEFISKLRYARRFKKPSDEAFIRYGDLAVTLNKLSLIYTVFQNYKKEFVGSGKYRYGNYTGTKIFEGNKTVTSEFICKYLKTNK